MRSSFVFDANRCTGCQACQLACVIENGLEPEASWRQIFTFNPRHLPEVPLFHLSLACNHCESPACLEACPARAYSKDATTGAVLIEAEKCIGCRYCSWACPYDAPRFDEAAGVMTKCTFCNDRVHRGEQPACAALCPTDALRLEKLPEERITHEVEGFPRTELGPAIRIVPLREGRQAPEPSADVPEMPFHLEPRAAEKKKASLRSEWSLALFTLGGATLFAVMAAVVAGASSVGASGFAVGAMAAMALATVHLDRKMSAWRAVLGFDRSWLSREIVFFSAFAVLGTLYLGWMADGRGLGGAVLLLGIAALFSMDRVYRYAVRAIPVLPHSAAVLLTGLFLAAALTGHPFVASGLGAAKLLLYVARKFSFAGRNLPVRPEITALRIACGFVLPPLLWIAGPSASGVAFASVLIGETIDRCEFYAELDFLSPARQMAADLTRRSSAVALARAEPVRSVTPG